MISQKERHQHSHLVHTISMPQELFIQMNLLKNPIDMDMLE